MSDCRFGVSPVNYPDPDPDPDQTPSMPNRVELKVFTPTLLAMTS